MKSIIEHLIELRQEPEQLLYEGCLYKAKRDFSLRVGPTFLSPHEIIPKDTILLLLSREKIGNNICYVFLSNNKKLHHSLNTENEIYFYGLFEGVRENG